MFAVMGITGNVGGAVANTLLQQVREVRGLVRDAARAQAWREKSVEIMTANYDDALTAAFADVEGLFCMLPPNALPEPGFPDSVARIAAIKRAVVAVNPPSAVFLPSNGGENTSGLGMVTPAHLLEEELGNIGVPSAFLRAGSFRKHLAQHSYCPLDRRVLCFLPTSRAALSWFYSDIGRIGAEILLQPWQGNRFVEISGPSYYSRTMLRLL